MIQTWKLLLPMLRKQMQAKNSAEKTPLLYCLFQLEKGSEDILCTMEHLSGSRYKSQLDKENTFYDLMLKNSNGIKEEWHTVTLLIDFENKTATTSIYDKKKQLLKTIKY